VCPLTRQLTRTHLSHAGSVEKAAYTGCVLLWSLSVAANDWESSQRLTRMCAIPINGVLEAQWDSGTMAMEARILRPLWWFGLLEPRQKEIAGSCFEASHFYRKTPLFDRFLSFNVNLEPTEGSRH
jgi:hypothetical protein